MRPDIKDSLDRYVKDKCPVGNFLTAVLSNNLIEALGRADEDNQRDIFEICSYVYNHMPSGCHGSSKKVTAWLASR